MDELQPIEEPIETPTTEQISTEESDRSFFDKYIDEHVVAPETIRDRRDAHRALRLLRETQFTKDETLDVKDMLNRVEAISDSPQQPPLAHLAAIEALEVLTNRAPQLVNPNRIEEILAKFEYVISILDNEDTRTFKSINDAYLHQMVLLAAIYNSRGLDTPNFEEFPENSQRLRILAELLRTKRLRMVMPKMVISTKESEGGQEILEEGLPDRNVLLSTGRLADERKMEDACIYWGAALNGGYQLRLPGALITMETDKRDIVNSESRVIGNTRNLYYVRLLPIEDMGESNDSILSGLTYYLAVKVSRNVENRLGRYSVNPQPKRLSSKRATYNEKGLVGLIEIEIDDIIEYISTPITRPIRRAGQATGEERSYPSILDTALREYLESEKIMLNIDDIKAGLKNTLMNLLVVGGDTRSERFRCRDEAELSSIAITQSLSNIYLDDLVFLTREFLNRNGVRTSLNEEQKAFVDDPEVRAQLNSIMEEIRTKRLITADRAREIETTLRAFLENIMHVRYETIRNNQVFENSTNWRRET